MLSNQKVAAYFQTLDVDVQALPLGMLGNQLQPPVHQKYALQDGFCWILVTLQLHYCHCRFCAQGRMSGPSVDLSEENAANLFHLIAPPAWNR